MVPSVLSAKHVELCGPSLLLNTRTSVLHRHIIYLLLFTKMTEASDSLSSLEKDTPFNGTKTKGLSFWLIVLSIFMSLFLSALELVSAFV